MKRLVIARYKKDISWADAFNSDVLVYEKDTNLSGINEYQILSANKINLTNIGREAHTYLMHIIINYHSLADIEIFAQDDALSHYPNFIHEINHIQGNNFYVDYSYLPSSILRWYGHMRSNEQNYINTEAGLFYRRYFVPHKETSIVKPFAIFAVSKNRILQHPLEKYQEILQCFDNTKYSDYEVINSMYWLEYTWHMIFDER